MPENRKRLEKLVVGLEFMISRAQAKNAKTMRTDGSYQAIRAVRDTAHAILPVGHHALAELDKMVTKLAPGRRRPVDDNGEQPRRRQPRKPRLPSPKKQRALLPVTDPAYANYLRALPSLLYAELTENEDPESEFGTKLTHAAAQEVMMSTSLWPHELAQLKLEHLKDDGEQLLIDLPTRGMSSGFEIMGHSRNVITTYIRRIRANRPGYDSDHLFPGANGRARHPNSLPQAVRRLIGECTGHPISAKDLRAAICIMHALHSDASDAVVQRFLGRRQADNDPILNLIAAWRRKTD